jgi:hypothetical protein
MGQYFTTFNHFCDLKQKLEPSGHYVSSSIKTWEPPNFNYCYATFVVENFMNKVGS